MSLHAVGAAIPLCLSLSLAIRDAIPGGEPDADEGAAAPGGEVNNSEPLVRMDVRTGSKQVHDEITPDDEVGLPCPPSLKPRRPTDAHSVSLLFPLLSSRLLYCDRTTTLCTKRGPSRPSR